MKSGEVWKYKNLIVDLIDSHLADLSNEDFPSAFFVRVIINNIEKDKVRFREINTTDYEHTMDRSIFVQIFEKDWRGERDKEKR